MTSFTSSTPLLKEYLVSLLFSLALAFAATLIDSNRIHTDLHSFIAGYCDTVKSSCDSKLDEMDVLFATTSDITELNEFGVQIVSAGISSNYFSDEIMNEIDESALGLFEKLADPNSGVASLGRLLSGYIFYMFFGCTFYYTVASFTIAMSKTFHNIRELSPKTSIIRPLIVSSVFIIYIVYL